MSQTPSRPVLFFDGCCHLCSGLVRFFLRHDKKKAFLFAPLQSPAGEAAIANAAAQQGRAEDSVILLYKQTYYTRSDAALRALILLGGGWRLFRIMLFLPRSLRDSVYKFISARRYRWFGRKSQCTLPSAADASRFITHL